MPNETEVDRQRARIHKLADTVQKHELDHAGYNAKLEMIIHQVEILQATTVDRDLLNATVGIITAKQEYMHQENLTKFTHFESKIDDITNNFNSQMLNATSQFRIQMDNVIEKLSNNTRAINWAAGIIVSGFIVALLSLVWK